MAQLKDLIVNGSSRLIGDTFATSLQTDVLTAPTTSNGSTYGPGTDGQILKTNGEKIYWANSQVNTASHAGTAGYAVTAAYALSGAVRQDKTTQENWRKILLCGTTYTSAWNAAVATGPAITYQAQAIAAQPSTGTIRVNNLLATTKVQAKWFFIDPIGGNYGSTGIAAIKYVGENADKAGYYPDTILMGVDASSVKQIVAKGITVGSTTAATASLRFLRENGNPNYVLAPLDKKGTIVALGTDVATTKLVYAWSATANYPYNTATSLGKASNPWEELFLKTQTGASFKGVQFVNSDTVYGRIGCSLGGVGIYGHNNLYVRPSTTNSNAGFIITSDAITPSSTTMTIGVSGTRFGKLFVGTSDSYGGVSTAPIYWNAGVPAEMTNINLSNSSTSPIRVSVTNSNGGVSILAYTNRGLYDEVNSNWIIYETQASDHIYVPKWASKGSETKPVYFNSSGEPTAITVNSVLTDLASTTAVSIYDASPRPGVTGTLPVANGGTGQTTIADIQAGKDGAGNTISATYVKKAGDTMTGPVINTFSDNSTARHFTNLVFYENNAESFTGTIKIKLPNTTDNCVMMICRIMIFDYNSNSGCDLLVSGYTYYDKKWYNYAACPQGTFTKGVRLAYDGTNYCILLGTTSSTWNYSKIILADVWSGYQLQPSTGYSISLITNESGYTITASLTTHLRAGQIWGAVWNDYAEYRKDNINEKEQQQPGRCVYELGDGSLALTTQRLQRGCEIISDTFGFAIGQDEEKGYNTPVASSGRVLAYPYESINDFASHIGYPVCSGPDGTVSIMTDEEERSYPSCIIGTISEIPTYKTWGEKDVQVNNRVWIRIR